MRLKRYPDYIRRYYSTKSLEEALIESEKRYRSLLEASSDAIFIMDGDQFIDCNRKATDILACSESR